MKRVAIVGFAESSRDFAPWDDQTIEIWGLNAAYRPGFMKRADRWFEMHNRVLIDATPGLRRPVDHIQWLGDFEGPVYMQQTWPDIPNSVRYPLGQVIDCVGPYLTSSVAMMIGLAILEGFEEIQLYGVDMAYEDYLGQRAGCEYLLGFARGRGITIMLPETSPLLQAPIYGYGHLNPEGEHISDTQFVARLDTLQEKREQIARDLAMIDGAIMETKHWIDVTPEGARLSAVEDRIDQAVWVERERLLKRLVSVGESHAVQ